MTIWGDILRKLRSLVAAPAGPRVRAGGRVWLLSPEGAALFGATGPDYDRWLSDGSAVVVKHGPHRTVYRVALPCGAVVYAKHCRITGPRAWAREVVRPPKARLEFENAARLRALGIGAAVPLAWGARDSCRPGESVLITRDLAPAVPLTDFADALTARGRRELARALGQFLARLHDGGVTHPDPHAGNVLVGEEPTPPAPAEPNPPAPFPRREGGAHAHSLPRAGSVPESATTNPPPSLLGKGAGGLGSSLAFALLDVHAVHFGAPLSWAESRANLILYNRWFQLRASAADRARFWRAYSAARTTLAVTREHARELECATRASNRRFWIARTARYAGTHRTIRKVRAGRVRGLVVRDLPDDFLRELLRDPDAAFTMPGVKVLKRCATSTVAELELPTPDGPRAVILKRVNVRSALEPLKNFYRSSAVRRSWLLGHGLRERWLPTPRPLAMFHRYRLGIYPAEGYLLTEKVPGAVGLSEAVRACRDPRALRAWGEKLARVVRTMHDRGVSHRDLKAPNVLLGTGATPVLIDLVGVCATAADVPFERRAKELARLNASFLEMPHVTRGERLRFLRAYLCAGGSEPDWKKWWKAVSEATAAKVAKNRRSGRTLA
jgi:tRNA A-37 threonylcarbamoyl transferase component Bud32